MKIKIGDKVRYVFCVGTKSVECIGYISKVKSLTANINDGHSCTYKVLRGHILEIIKR